MSTARGMMLRAFATPGLLLATLAAAAAQTPPGSSGLGYPTVAAALNALRAKPGLITWTQAGWTAFEDQSSHTIWSFVPEGHAAYPAAIRRTVVQEGDDISVEMGILCEAAKRACDRLAAHFAAQNQKLRDELKKRPSR